MTDNPSSLEIKRTTEVLEVMALIFADPTMTTGMACDAVGITTDVYYYWLRKDPEALHAIRNFLADSQRQELAYLSAAVTAAHMQLARKALNDDTDVGERLKIVKYLNQEAEKLQQVYQVTSGGGDAEEFLKRGPKTDKKQSKFASMTVSPEYDGSVKVDFYRDEDIIDAVEVTEPLDEPDSA